MFDLALRKIIGAKVSCTTRHVFLEFLIFEDVAEFVDVNATRITVNNEYTIWKKQAPGIFDLLGKVKKYTVKGGKIIFDFCDLPEIFFVLHKELLLREVPEKFEDYVFLRGEHRVKQEYLFDFIPDKGVVQIPSLFVYEKMDTFYYHERIKCVVNKDDIVVFSHDWIEHSNEKCFIKAEYEDVSIGVKEEKSKVLTVKESCVLAQEMFYGYASRHDEVRYSPRFRGVLLHQVSHAFKFAFKEGRLSAKIVLALHDYDVRFYGHEIISEDPNDVRQGCLIEGDRVYAGLTEEASRKVILTDLGFKKGASGNYLYPNDEKLVKMFRKVKNQKTIMGVRILLDESIEEIDMATHEVESAVSVRLDNDKSLIYLDTKYYMNKKKIDREVIMDAIHNKNSYIPLENTLIKFDYKKAQALEKDAKSVKELPLDKYYLLHQLSRQANRTMFSKSYKRFFENLSSCKALPHCPLPKEFGGKTRESDVAVIPYQQVGFRWLSFLAKNNLNGILADEMGLGKTLQSLLVVFSSKHFRTLPTMIVCPKSLVENWKHEILKFFDFPEEKILIHHGPERRKKFDQKVCNSCILISTYETVRLDVEEIRKIEFNYIIADEAQRIKNPRSQNSRSLKVLKSKHKIALTGTPIENRLLDLWSIFDFLLPGFFGSISDFRKEYEIPIVRNDDKNAKEKLKLLVDPLKMRRKVEDEVELPALAYHKEICDLSAKQLSLYDKIWQSRESQQILEDVRKGKISPTSLHVLKILGDLMKVCSHPALVEGGSRVSDSDSGKMSSLFSKLSVVLSDEENHVLVFVRYKKVFTMVEMWCKKNNFTHEKIWGDTPMSKRTSIIEKFNRGDIQVLLVGIQVGGVGINLQKANYVFIFDRWWNPAVEQQCVSRAHRKGQTRSVTSYRFVTKGTIEERLEELHDKKRKLGESVLDGSLEGINLSKEDVLNLLDNKVRK